MTGKGYFHCRSLTTISWPVPAQAALLLRRQLPLADRATMVPLLYSVLDFQASPTTYERYDRMSARELFQR